MHRLVGSHDVHGVVVDPETRCAHYDSEQDVVAFKFECCEMFFPCHACHDAVADHNPQLWPRNRFDHPAVLCGICHITLSITQYLTAAHECPACGAAFNPGCAAHYDRYFEEL